MHALLPFIKLFKKQLKWIALGTGLSLLAVLASIGLLALSGWFISITGYIATTGYIVASQFNYFYPAAGVRSFSLFRIASRYGERMYTHQATFKILTSIRIWFYRCLEPLAPSHLMKYGSGDLLNKIVNDINDLDNLYLRIISPTIVLILMTFFVAIFYSFFSYKIAIMTTVFILVTGFGVPFFIMMLSKKSSSLLNKDHADLKICVVEQIQSLAELKIFPNGNKQFDKFKTNNDIFIKRQTRLSFATGIGTGLITLFMGITILSALWVSVNLVHNLQMNGAFIALILLGIIGSFEAIMPLPVAYQYLGKTITAAKKILAVTNAKPDVIFKETNQNIPTNYTINFENITFSYDGKKNILQDFNLKIKHNEKIALFAPTGSGKTTILNLLTRFFDAQKGSVSIGDMNINGLSEHNLRNNMTIINQKPYIFNGTIRDNLLLANKDAGDEELLNALKMVELDVYVNGLKNKMDTWCGEYGKHLSGGQQKRLGLARAFLREKPILVLDEPTEGLDNITEQVVFNNLKVLMENKTVILVTHNAELLKSFSRVINL